MTSERRVILHPDKESLTGAMVARFITKVVDLIADNGEATIALEGGRMGTAVLTAINESPARDSIDWSRVNIWWSDERWVPAGDPERNDHKARAALLDHVPLDPARVHPYAASDSGISLDEAAAAYAAELEAAAPEGERHPRLDIVFLGMGPDAHVASLFPGKEGIREKHATVISVRNSPKPPAERLSLTLPVINAAQRVWLVVAGSDKASALGLTLADASVDEVPASGVEGRKRTLFFVDEGAAAEVPENLIDPGQFWTGADDPR